MLEDKLRATDWEATNELIEEQVARESYLQWFKDNERRKKSVVSMGYKFRVNLFQLFPGIDYEIRYLDN